jgi:hypothetical protein
LARRQKNTSIIDEILPYQISEVKKYDKEKIFSLKTKFDIKNYKFLAKLKHTDMLIYPWI